MPIYVGGPGGHEPVERRQPPPRYLPFDPNKGHYQPLKPDPFRLGLYTVNEIYDDYVVATGWDPVENAFLTNVAIALPYMLQRTPHDQTERDFDGSVKFYEYTGTPGRRLVTATINGEEVQELQKITEDYLPGVVISAVRAQLREQDASGAVTEDGKPIAHIDLNIDGRAWAFFEPDSD